MRNYWLKILLGAFGIFAVGMIGVTIVRSGVAKVNSVVHSDEPITIPLGLVPFVLAGERLGKLDHVTLYRESPNHVSEVELTVNLADSLLAQGLSGCRLVANIEGDNREPGVNIRVGKDSANHHSFRCLPEDSVPPDLVGARGDDALGHGAELQARGDDEEERECAVKTRHSDEDYPPKLGSARDAYWNSHRFHRRQRARTGRDQHVARHGRDGRQNRTTDRRSVGANGS